MRYLGLGVLVGVGMAITWRRLRDKIAAIEIEEIYPYRDPYLDEVFTPQITSHQC